MKILVTGAAGFIGSYVARALLADGHEVVGLDNFNGYYAVGLKEARHAQLEKLKGYHGVRLDLEDCNGMEALFAAEGFERVCHLAAQPGVRYSRQHPQAYERSNLAGHLNVLEGCRRHHVDRLVYASSSSVYGAGENLPFHESAPTDRPTSLYAATKKANELMAYAYTHLYGFQSVGLRFFTVYGPQGRPDMAYWLFSEAMLKGEPVKVFNCGEMQRDFTCIDDIVPGVCAALFAAGLERYEVFNLGNSRPEKLMDMIAILGEVLGVEPQMEMLPMQPGDVPVTWADIGRAQSKLGYAPAIKLRSGLRRFAEWFRAAHDRPA